MLGKFGRKKMEKNYFVAISDTFKFIFNHPVVLVFTLLRVILFGLIYIITTYFLPELQLEHILKNTAPFFQSSCFGDFPCGLLILYFFLAAGLEVGIATSRYVQANFRYANMAGFQTIQFSYNLLTGLFWSLILTPCYFYIFKHFLAMPNVAPLLYFLTPIPLLIMLLVLLPSFFLAPVLAQNSANMSTSLTNAWQVMRANFGKSILFILIMYVLLEVGIFVLLNAVNQHQVLTQVLVGLCLAILITFKDVFKALVAAK